MGFGIMKKPVDSIPWQDYRASNTGMVVFYVSDPVSEVPIREIPEEADSPIVPEPNYENRVYGFYGCIRPKIRNAFFKSKIRYIFFCTKYAGTKEDFKDKYIITGYFRINKAADVQKLHLRYIPESGCMETDQCIALRADEIYFVGLNDAYLVTDEVLKSWGYNAKINKQLRIILDVEKTGHLLDYLKSKQNQAEAYIKETKRLGPHEASEEEDSAMEEQPMESPPVDSTSAMEEQPTESPPVDSTSVMEEQPTESPPVDSTSVMEEQATESPSTGSSSIRDYENEVSHNDQQS